MLKEAFYTQCRIRVKFYTGNRNVSVLLIFSDFAEQCASPTQRRHTLIAISYDMIYFDQLISRFYVAGLFPIVALDCTVRLKNETNTHWKPIGREKNKIEREKKQKAQLCRTDLVSFIL